MMTSDDIYQLFQAALIKKSESYGRGFKAFLGACGCATPTYIGQLLKGTRTASLKKQKAIAKALDFEYEDFLNYGKESPPGKSAETEQSETDIKQAHDRIEKEHQDIIKRFKNKEAGKEVNEFLIELENLSVRDFQEIIGKIKGLVYELRQKQEEQAHPQNGGRRNAG